MAKRSSQKFIAANRAPRVQIEYDVETYGAEKTVELPFIMGVLADLSGKPAEKLPPVAERKMLEIDVDNFNDRLKAMKPRVAFQVPNTLTGEGNLSVDVTFESMDDFSPAAVARKVDALNKLLEARTQLANLLTYMDGKSGAEELIGKLLKDPALLSSLAAKAKPAEAGKAASAGAKTAAPKPPAPQSKPAASDDDLGGLLGDEPATPAPAESTATAAAPAPPEPASSAPAASSDDLDDLLGDLDGDGDAPEASGGGASDQSSGDDDLDNLLADL